MKTTIEIRKPVSYTRFRIFLFQGISNFAYEAKTMKLPKDIEIFHTDYDGFLYNEYTEIVMNGYSMSF